MAAYKKVLICCSWETEKAKDPHNLTLSCKGGRAAGKAEISTLESLSWQD